MQVRVMMRKHEGVVLMFPLNIFQEMSCGDPLLLASIYSIQLGSPKICQFFCPFVVNITRTKEHIKLL